MLIELNFHKTAEDTRPEAGWWGRQMAAHRATRKDHSWLVDEELRPLNRKHLGITALTGALPAYGVYNFERGMFGTSKPMAAGLAAVLGLNIGSMVGTTVLKKQIKDYFASRGIDYSIWTGAKGMTDEAKMKYLSKKYRGGGYA